MFCLLDFGWYCVRRDAGIYCSHLMVMEGQPEDKNKDIEDVIFSACQQKSRKYLGHGCQIVQ